MYHLIAYKILYLTIYFVFKRNLLIFHIIQGHFQKVPIHLRFYFQNCKFFLKYFGVNLLTTAYTKNNTRNFIYLFIYEVTTTKVNFCFYEQCSQAATCLTYEPAIFPRNPSIALQLQYSFILCKISPGIFGKCSGNGVKTCTPIGPKFVEKIKFKAFHYIQHDFICQHPGLSEDQTSMFKSLVINYFILKCRHTL